MKAKFNNIFDAILGLNEVLRFVNKLQESILINEYFNKHLLEAETKEEKTILQFDAQALLKKVYSYKIKLEEYVNHSDLYDNTDSIQERNLKFTTNSFFLDVVKPVRSRALSALKQLKRMISKTKDDHDRDILNVVIEQILDETNILIDDCANILEYDKKIIIDLKKKGIDYRKKFDLIPISWEDI